MKRITSFEIRCFKELLKIYRNRIINLELENEELRKQLEESRAKEGKGCLENLMDCIVNDFKALVEAIEANDEEDSENENI